MSAFAKAVYAFSGEGQAVPLPLADSAVVLVVERNLDGWCRGFSGGKEGWFPASYVKDIEESALINNGTPPTSLATVLRSPKWNAYATTDNKIYYVNVATQETTWMVPPITPPPAKSPTTPSGSSASPSEFQFRSDNRKSMVSQLCNLNN
jgi:hypothetical protein